MVNAGCIMRFEMKNFWFSLGFLVICISCSDNPGTNTPDVNKKAIDLCPSDGANLYLKCADGREKVFGLGYKGEPFYVRRNGKWDSKAVGEFCNEEPSLIDFYFSKAHFRITGQKANGKIIIWPQESASSKCQNYSEGRFGDHVNLKLESIPSGQPRLMDNPDLM